MGSTLSEARNKTVTKPLEANEVGFLYDDKTVSRIVKDLKRKKYGPYLIGGIVGTGKTSQIEIASHLAFEKPLIVHIKFYDQEEYRNEFEKILLSALIKTVRENVDSSKNSQLTSLLDLGEEMLNYKIDEVVQEKKTEGKNAKTSGTVKNSIFGKTGIGVKSLLNAESGTNFEMSGEYSRDSQKSQESGNSVTKTRIQRRLLEIIYKILMELSEYRVIIIYDELDKMNEDALEVLFSKFKELFVEKDIFSFFVVDDRIYKKYQNAALLDNPIRSYFMNIYYAPLLRMDETFRYVKRCFSEMNYMKGLVAYYLSLGNYRMLNQIYALPGAWYDGLNLSKAYILKKVMKSLNKNYFDDYMKDLLVRKIKTVIEHIVLVRQFQVEELAAALNRGNSELEIWPDYAEIIRCVIKVLREICPGIVTENEDGITLVKCELLIDQAQEIRKSALGDRKITVDEAKDNSDKKMIENIQTIDMYELGEKSLCLGTRHIEDIWEDITALEVADNNPDCYRDILVRILETTLLAPNIQVLVMRRAREETSSGFNDYEYTGMVIVEKEAYQVAYYVNRGSYDSERKGAINDLIEKAKKLQVNVCKATLLEPIDIEKEIHYVARRYNQRSVIKEDSRLVFDDWKK